MSRRLRVPAWGSGWRVPIYPLMAVVLVGLGLGQVLSAPATPRLWLTVLGLVVSTAAVAAFGIALLPAVLAVIGVDVVLQLVSGSPPFATFLATMIGVYALARHGSPRQIVIGFLALAAGIASMAVSQIGSGSDSVFGLVIITVYVAVAAVLGWLTRQRSAYTRLILERADALRRERDQVAALAAATERTRLARELHDVISHGVSLMVLQAEAAAEVISVDPTRSAAGLDAIADAGRRAIADLRHMLGLLTESETADLPRELDLTALATGLRQTGLAVELEEVGSSEDLPEPIRSTIYRVVQESLTNVVKHAQATSVRVAVKHETTGTTIDVTDDGTGRSSTTAPGSRRGLTGMSQRVTDLGGSFKAGALAGGGFGVHARIPHRRTP